MGDTTLNYDSTLHSTLNVTKAPWQTSDHDASVDVRPSNLGDLTKPDFYRRESWFHDMCEVLFKLTRRKTTVKAELYYGLIHYISCLYCLAVVPQQMTAAGYDSRKTVVAVALCAGIGSIFCGLFANLPFVLAPPTVVSIFLSVFLQQEDEGPKEGSIAVLISGFILMFFGWKPLGRLAARLIPVPIQVGTAVGIGLMTALAGSTEVDLVERGEYTILKIGPITAEVCIAIAGIILISVATNFHIKGSFCLAVIFCSLVWWIYDNDFPGEIVAVPHVDTISFKGIDTSNTALLTVDLVFLYVLYLNGLMTSLSNLAEVTREDSTIPRGRWIFIVCGMFSIISGLVNSVPILVSPESSASIKEGAKTGLSAVVAGVLFLLSLFFSPLFEKVPSAGTSPILVMIGVILFQNVGRIDWRDVSSAAPAFVVLFYIPFTYSIIQGVIIGYVVYLTVSLFNGTLLINTVDFLAFYAPVSEAYLMETFPSLHSSRQSTSPSFDAAAPPRGSHEGSSLSRHKNQLAMVFDDRESEVGPIGHINGGDMAMTSSSSASGSANPNYNSTGHTTGAFADFGGTFRPTGAAAGTGTAPAAASGQTAMPPPTKAASP